MNSSQHIISEVWQAPTKNQIVDDAQLNLNLKAFPHSTSTLPSIVTIDKQPAPLLPTPKKQGPLLPTPQKPKPLLTTPPNNTKSAPLLPTPKTGSIANYPAAINASTAVIASTMKFTEFKLSPKEPPLAAVTITNSKVPSNILSISPQNSIGEPLLPTPHIEKSQQKRF